jgi:class 3 adenylate cyclase
MASLPETFRDPDARKLKTIVAVDLTNSTSMKEQQTEAAWLTTYGWFFEQLRATIGKHKGQVVKYLGDGAMAIFSEDNAADAINWAIEVQESLADAQAQNRVSCDCSIGIAYGEVVEFDVFDTSEGAKDYIGTIVDKAFRLCSAANSKAIFVDTDTCAAAAMNKVKSRLGSSTAPRRRVAEYQGEEESVQVKGFSRPVTYYEIFWGSTRYGVSPPFVTKLSSQQASTNISPPPSRPQPSSGVWIRGVVQNLSDRYGFIRSAEGEDFWFNPDCLFRKDLPVKWHDTVWFVPTDPLPNARNRRALDVLAMGAVLSGTLEKVLPQGYGFALCSNQSGNRKQLFIFLGSISGWSPGMEIEFKVGGNDKGIAGLNPRNKS